MTQRKKPPTKRKVSEKKTSGTTTSKKSKARTPPFEALPSWSTAKFFGFLRSGLRASYNKWPNKWEVLKKAQRPYQGPDKRCKWEYVCAGCGKLYKSADVSVDHIIPAGSLNSFDDLPGFCQRLFCGVDGLQLLCKGCHQEKTAQERKKKD